MERGGLQGRRLRFLIVGASFVGWSLMVLVVE